MTQGELNAQPAVSLRHAFGLVQTDSLKATPNDEILGTVLSMVRWTMEDAPWSQMSARLYAGVQFTRWVVTGERNEHEGIRQPKDKGRQTQSKVESTRKMDRSPRFPQVSACLIHGSNAGGSEHLDHETISINSKVGAV